MKDHIPLKKKLGIYLINCKDISTKKKINLDNKEFSSSGTYMEQERK